MTTPCKCLLGWMSNAGGDDQPLPSIQKKSGAVASKVSSSGSVSSGSGDINDNESQSGNSVISKPDNTRIAQPSVVDAFFLALVIALGGQYNRWTPILEAGFWPAIIAMLYTGTGYLCFAACMAEMSATLPFSGGVYGFVRAFIGPFFGYVVSCFEMFMIICYLSPLVQSLGTFPTMAGVSSETFEPAWWLFFSVSAVSIAMIGCNYAEYWGFIKLIGALSLLLLWIYIFGSLGHVNYDRWANGGESIEWDEFLPRIYQTAGMFRGVQYLPLVSIKLADPKRDIPRAMFFSIIVLVCTAIGVLFTSCSQYPGTAGLTNSFLPLTDGFSRIFNLTKEEARWLSFPALYANFYGFVWVCGRQFSSMAKSGLLPKSLGLMTAATDTPYVSLLVGMVLWMSLALVSYYDIFGIHFKDDVKHIFMLSSYVIAVSLFVSYIVFKQKYSSLPRSFTSPVGVYGAFLGILIFGSTAIAILINLGRFQLPLVALASAFVIMSVYYFMVLHGNQQFSEEEKEKLFKAYLINANLKAREAQKKHKSRPVVLSATNSPRINSRVSPSNGNGIQSHAALSDCNSVATDHFAADQPLPTIKPHQVAPQEEKEEELTNPEKVQSTRQTWLVGQLSEKVIGWLEEVRGSNKSIVAPEPLLSTPQQNDTIIQSDGASIDVEQGVRF